MLDDLFEFLQGAVTPYHAAAIAAAWLDAAGYTRLEEADYWNLEAGKGYYITRNGSSVIAWRVPEHAIGGWRIAASHSDSPCWKIKNEKVENDGCSRLSVEGYGGMIMSTWLDRPLTVAGRVMVKTEDGIESRLVNIDEDLLVIPSLAIHMQRNVNKGMEFNPQIDMQPLWGPAGCRTLTDVLCEELNVQPEDILDRDLQLVTRQQPTRIGPDGEYFLAPRIDDLECAATTLLAFLDAAPDCDSACAPVWAMFDNEEVGSSSRMGAESSYLRDVLDRIRLAQSTGKRHYIIVVAEGVGNTEELAQRIQRHTGIETRATILGHVQRGGAPTLRDRVVASRMGYHAAELLFNGIGNRVVAMKGEQIVDFDITEALNMPRTFDEKMYRVSAVLSI